MERSRHSIESSFGEPNERKVFAQDDSPPRDPPNLLLDVDRPRSGCQTDSALGQGCEGFPDPVSYTHLECDRVGGYIRKGALRRLGIDNVLNELLRK